jgi:lambda family phage tail tape measure protein
MATEIDELSVRITADTAAFKDALRDLGKEAESFSSAIKTAFKDAVLGGKDLESVLASLVLKLAGLALDKALQPLTSALGGILASLFGAFGLAEGGVVAGGRIRPFADGGVVAAPTYFPLQGGLGLMGEAGPEAVLPLARGSDGTLGVRTNATAPITVHFNVTTPDAEGFRKAEAQVTAMLARAVGRGRRGL